MTSKHRLAENSLGLAEAVVMGVAGTAPAFSAAATTATLIAAVGVLSPASLLYCGLIMFGVTLAFRHLNRADPNAGASYAWVDKAFGPVLGFLAGWSLIVASALFMVSGTVPAATATLELFAPRLTGDPTVVTLVAAGWLIAVSAVVVKGIKPASYTQVVLTTIEVGILVIVIVAALLRLGAAPAHAFSLTWLTLGGFSLLLMVDGMRFPPQADGICAIDPSIIPALALSRVERADQVEPQGLLGVEQRDPAAAPGEGEGDDVSIHHRKPQFQAL